MAISIDGLISGLDSTGIISQIIELERRPVKLLQNKQAILADQKTAWQAVSTRLLAFESAAGKMDTSSEFAARTADFRSNNTSGGTVLSVTSGSSAAAGTYNMTVTQLAMEQKSASAQSFTTTNTALALSGTVTITAPTTGSPVNIAVTSTDTLVDIRDAINNSGVAVTATIINAGSTASPAQKLILTADSTGSDNAFTAGTSMDAGSLSFSTSQSAQNANFTIDGVSVTKDSNSVTDVINNATISLETIGSGTITFATDPTAIIANINEFITAYNDLAGYMEEQLTYDVNKNTRGVLFGNATLMTIQNKIRSVVSGGVAGIDITDSNRYSFLSQVGIKNDDTNRLQLDETTLRDELKNNFDKVADLFVDAGSGTYTFISTTSDTTGGTYDTRIFDTGGGVLELQMKPAGAAVSEYVSLTQTGDFATGNTGTIFEGLIIQTGTLNSGETGTMNISVGVARMISGITANYTEYSTEGLIFNQNRSIEENDKEMQKQIADLEERIAKKKEDLRAEFASLEVLLSKMKSEQEYLSGQLAQLPSSM